MRGAFLAGSLCAAFAVTVQLSACSRDNREADIKECIASSRNSAAQLAAPGESEEDRHDRIGGEVAACMEKLGYRHDQISMAGERCVDDVDYNPYCYARRN